MPTAANKDSACYVQRLAAQHVYCTNTVQTIQSAIELYCTNTVQTMQSATELYLQ